MIHTFDSCPCGHAENDHDSTTRELSSFFVASATGSALQTSPVCVRCDHARSIRSESDDYLSNYVNILADQSERFIGQFQVDVVDAETSKYEFEPLLVAADAYERIALAEKRVDPAHWSRASNVDGRTAKDIMDRLWDVREELRRREDERTERKSPRLT